MKEKMSNIRVGSLFHGVCHGYTYDGLGILDTKEGLSFFVNGLIKGEEADVEVTFVSMKANYAKIRKITLLSQDRITPLCPVATACGGCSFQNLNYQKQLEFKKEKVINAFHNIAHIKFPVDDCVGMDEPYFYRNKTQMPLGLDRKGRLISGFYRAKSHDIIAIDKCVIEDKKASGILTTIKGLMTSMKILPYNEDTREGIIRHVLIRTSFHYPEVMVVIITNADSFPSRGNFVKALKKAHPEISTIVQNVNKRDTNVILGNQDNVLFGPGFIKDDILGVRYRISAKSFYQVNPLQTEKLYSIAIEKAQLTGEEVVLDAYCGIGTISLIAAKKAKEVIGVEIVKEAIIDAKNNARRNDINNASFYVDDAGEFMLDFVKSGKKLDVLFMDPPRKGADEKFLSSVLAAKPNKIIYVSCDPATLARDIATLIKSYKIESITPVDMFPQTFHVETVVCLSLKK